MGCNIAYAHFLLELIYNAELFEEWNCILQMAPTKQNFTIESLFVNQIVEKQSDEPEIPDIITQQDLKN